MEHEGFLIGFAQLSLVLTGFVSIFAATIAGKVNSFTTMHHAASMLAGGLVSLALSITPLVLNAYGFEGVLLWRYASAIGIAAELAYLSVILPMSLKLSQEQLKEVGIFHVVSSYMLGIVSFILLVLCVFTASNPGHYILAVTLIFFTAALGFITFAFEKILNAKRQNT